jgi:hypothetical protein
MNNRSFWEFWVVDSALRGQDPIARFMQGLYAYLWIPFAFLGLVCLLTDTNYFFILGMFLKGTWTFSIKTVWYALTHWDKVVWFFRSIISPGCCGSDPGF